MPKIKKVHIELFTDESRCEDCGYFSMPSCKITSNIKRLNEQFGSADCCTLEEGTINDVIIFLNNELSLNIPYSEETNNILKEKDLCFYELQEQPFNYGIDKHFNYFDVSDFEYDKVKMLSHYLKEKNIQFTFEDKIKK